MKIKIFMASASNQQEIEILKSLGQGIEKHISSDRKSEAARTSITRVGRWAQYWNTGPDYDLEYEYAEGYKECDVAVIFGSWKPREKGTHITRNSVAANATKFLVIETPLLGRKTSTANSSFRIGLNGYLNRDAYWPVLDDTDADLRLSKMGVKFNGWKNKPDGHVVVALQLAGDASLRGADINDWAHRTITTIRERCKKTIIVRNHPLCSDRAFIDHDILARKLWHDGIDNIKFSDGRLNSWLDDLQDAYCSVTYSSGLAIDSVLAGIPTIACDPGNFAWGISTNDPADIHDLKMLPDKDIKQWLRFLSGCQWTLQEMKDSTAWKYLEHMIRNT